MYTIRAVFYNSNKCVSDGYILMDNRTGGYVIRDRCDVLDLASDKLIVNALCKRNKRGGTLSGRYGYNLNTLPKLSALDAYGKVYIRNRKLQRGDIDYSLRDSNL